MAYTAIDKLHPEVGAGGFTANDGTIAFYSRVTAIASADATVLDFGAGRGAWAQEDTLAYRKACRNLRGRVGRVIGCDVDEVVLSNPAVDEAYVLQPNARLPFADGSLDVIIADYVLEHIDDPKWFADEMHRLLRPGGWLCARTPSKFHYVSMASAMMPEWLQEATIRRAQTDRKKEDVFPAHYRLNTLGAIARHFPAPAFENCSYVYKFEPQYHFGSTAMYRSFQFLHWLLPPSMTGNLFIFVRKAA